MRKVNILYLICFFAGCITCLIVLIGAFIIDTKGGKIVPLNTPCSFGNIKIWVEKVSGRDKEIYDFSKGLRLAKDDIPFILINMDKAGKISSLSITNRKNLRFTMAASRHPGKWERAIYVGYNDANYPTGETYVDINFDGHFDIKHVFDDAGKKVSTYIYINSSWIQVNSCDAKEDGITFKAVLGQTMYVFDPNSGWHYE